MILIELDTKVIEMDLINKEVILVDAQKSVNNAVKNAMKEDKLDEEEGFLLPVKNYWIVDKLRDDLSEKDRLLDFTR